MHNKILLRAAELIEQRGWCQGQSRCNGRICLVTAIGIANLECSENHNERIFDTFRKYLNVPGLASWNDNPKRTKEEVINKLKECANVPEV